MEVKYYPLSFVRPVLSITLNLSSERATINEVKDKMRQAIYQNMLAEGEEVKLEDVQYPIICVSKDNKIEMMARSDFEINCLDRGYKLVALERQQHDLEMSKIIPVQLMISQTKSSYMIYKAPQLITHSRILIFNKESTVRQIKKKIFQLFRPIIQGLSPDSATGTAKPSGNEQAVLECEYRAFFEDG